MSSKWEEISRAIEGASSAEEVREAIFRYRGKSYEALVRAAEISPVLDEGLLLAILATGSGVHHVLKNPALPEWGFARISQWEINRLHSEAAKDPIYQAVSTLKQITKMGRLPLDSPEYQELVEVVMPPKKKKPSNMAFRQEGALDVLLSRSDLPVSFFAELLARMRQAMAGYRWVPVIIHPNCPQEVRREVVRSLIQSPQHDTLEALVRSDALRMDPEIRPILWQWAQGIKLIKLWTPFLKDAIPEEVRPRWQGLYELNPAAAAQALAEEGDRLAPYLTKEDIAPLLSSEKQEQRLAAIQVSGLVGTSPEPALVPSVRT